jgi:hypothetical protein
MDEPLSLRPLSLRPGAAGGAAANPFANLGKGAGFALKSRAATLPSAPAASEGPRKPASQIIRYNKEFLLRFMEVGARPGGRPIRRAGGRRARVRAAGGGARPRAPPRRRRPPAAAARRPRAPPPPRPEPRARAPPPRPHPRRSTPSAPSTCSSCSLRS